MKANLSVKEQNFLKAYLETGNISESAKRAGSKGKDTYSLYNSGRAIIERCGFTLQEIQEAKGITDSYLSEKLQDGLQATKRYYGSWQGQIIQSEESPDHTNRLKALEIAHRLRGQFIDRTELTGKDGGDIILAVKPAISRKEAKKIELDMD